MGIKNSLAIGLTLASFTLTNGQALAQKPERIRETTGQDLAENFATINHNEIIASKISDLERKYGREKTQELLRKHALIEINKYKKGEKYTYNEFLSESGQQHADDMSKKDYFGHKDLQGNHVWDRIDSTKYNYEYLGENISNDNNISDIVISYLKSKKGGHEEIFEGKYKDIGIGIAHIVNITTDTPKYYFVFDFGKSF